MKFKIEKASDDFGTKPKELEINTLEDLINLIEEYGSSIILEKYMYGDEIRRITIYDDYIE